MTKKLCIFHNSTYPPQQVEFWKKQKGHAIFCNVRFFPCSRIIITFENLNNFTPRLPSSPLSFLSCKSEINLFAFSPISTAPRYLFTRNSVKFLRDGEQREISSEVLMGFLNFTRTCWILVSRIITKVFHQTTNSVISRKSMRCADDIFY